MPDTPTNTNQLNAYIDELVSKVSDALRAALGVIDIGESGDLGFLATVNNLASAPVGNSATLRDNIGFVAASLVEMQKYGIGSVGSPRLNDIGQMGAPSSIYSFNASTGTSGELPSFSSGSIIYCYSAVSNGNYALELALDRNGKKAEMRAAQGGTNFSSWCSFLTEGAYTIDPNGFLKTASPIFRLSNSSNALVSDKYTDGGAGVANDEAEGVTATHDDVGVYTVSGSLGFATEGWKFEPPQDDNKNVLLFVEAETASDGTITVRTFSRRFDYEKVAVVAGDPMDIPDGEFISLRLAMPENSAVPALEDQSQETSQ